tara:strand:- start:96 stop:251 length:156 start_codon:yes stop_codon:yes gene_type:complete
MLARPVLIKEEGIDEKDKICQDNKAERSMPKGKDGIRPKSQRILRAVRGAM